MTRAAGDGNGRRGPAGTAVLNPAELGTLDAPGRLARALSVTGNDVPAAARLLRQAGCPVSITAGRNDLGEDGDGLWAPHPVNITAAGWSYSAAGSPGHEKCCAARTRGVYQGQRTAGRLPYEHTRVMTPEGRVWLASYLLSITAGGPRALVTYDDIDRGRWAHRLGMALSRDRTIRDAVVTVLLELVNSPDLPERPHALTPSTRTPDGRSVPVPEWSTLPPGYGDQPATPDTVRLAARGALADVAADCPQVALLLGASAGAPLAAATRVQSCGWELVAAPRTGKTTTMQAIAAVWGNPSLPPDPGIMMSWDATSRGMGRLAGMLGTIPFIADETGTADFDPAEWSRFQYGMAQGGARTLATQSGEGMKRTGGWAGCWFTSGNGSIAENRSGKFAGIAARVITLTGPFTTSAGQACQLRDASAGDYGYLGPAVLAAVDVDQFRAWHAAARVSICAPEGGVLGTTGDQLAAAVAGAMGVDLVLGTGNRLAAAAARAARDYLATTAEPEPDRERLLHALAEWLSSNRPAWADRAAYEALGKPADVSGVPAPLARHGYLPQLDGLRDDGWLYVYPGTWDRLVAETGVAATIVLRELRDRGDLDVPSASRGEWRARAPRWAGRVPVYKLRLSALDSGADDDDGQDPGPGQSPARETPPDDDAWAAEAAAMDAYRQAELPDPLPAPAAAEYVRTPPVVSVATSEQDPARRRAEWLAAARDRRPFTSDDQWAEFERRAVMLDAPDIGDHPERLRILAALEGHQDNTEGRRGRVIPGPFAPRRDKRPPFWRPWGSDGIPPAVETALVVSAWAWQREGYSGPAVTLDRSGAWVAGTSSALFAHGALTRTGPWDGTGTPRPGYYLATVYPWTEPGMPAPLGPVKPGGQVWVPAPTMGLLRELAEAGRWPDGEAADSWTGEPCRLTEWSHLTAELRRYAIEMYGRDSDAYGAVKQGFGQAMSLLKGSWAQDTTMPKRTWKCLAQRLDWPDHAQAQAAVTMWRAGDACARLTGPELAPLAVGRNTDELVIPAAALDIVTRDMLPGKARPPVTLDPLGIALGTFKVKGREDW